MAKKFEYLGVKTAKDLLYYFPFRYEDYSKIFSIAQLRAGELATICGQVELIGNKRSWRGRKTITEALVSDKSGSVRVVWFNQPFLIKNIHAGDVVYLSGKTQADALGPKLVSPIYESAKSAASSVIASHSEAIPKYSSVNNGIAASADANRLPRNDKQNIHTARLVPIYSTTYGLTQKQIRFLVSRVVELADKIKEWLPADILEEADLIPLAGALRGIHFPADNNDLKLSADRLKFDELFLTQLRVELARQERSALRAPSILFKEDKIKNFVASLPFTLTKPQKISAWEILRDIAKTTPMNRLVSGDVGSGKTVVAAVAMYDAFLNGYQAVMMAPTEILAQQHYRSLEKLFGKLNIRVGLLTGSQKPKLKKEIVTEINKGKLGMIVGTHALLSEDVFSATSPLGGVSGSASGGKNLGLVIVDEQHRFGVEQRKLIKQKGRGAHFLSMTATPIPRSLALMIYGDLDVSIINELPPGRKKIITRIVEPVNRNKAYQFIRDQVARGRQVFVICPLIEQKDESEIEIINYPANPSSEKKSVLSEYEKLSRKVFPDLRVGYLHGKMKPAEKDGAMDDFKNKKTDILVSTSVVEVGVDIPNAGIMMIEGAESFGLAQLHQFRGRVGRSTHQSYCLLFTHHESARAGERLRFFEQNSDGFKLAEKDLAMRGPGEVYGTEQSGLRDLRLAKLTDFELIKKAREAAKKTILNLEDYPSVLGKIKDWENKTHLE